MFPDVDDVRKLLKEAILRAIMAKYRFDGNKNRKAKTSTKASANEIINQTSPGLSLLSGILAEMPPQTSINFAKHDLVHENNVEQEPESDSDEDSGCDINDCAFFDNEEEGDIYDDKVDDVLSSNWQWNRWENISDDDSIPGPVEDDHYY